MKYEEMKELYEYMRDTMVPVDIKEWQDYQLKMEKLLKELEPYYEEGSKKGITKVDYERIDKVFDEFAKSSDAMMKAYKKVPETEAAKKNPSVNDMVKNINDEFFAKGYVEFKNIKPNENIPLKDQLEDFRFVSVQVSNNDIKKLGGNQSSRLQMNVNIDGQEVKGVFTNMTHFNGRKDMKSVFPELYDKYPKYEDFFKSIDGDEYYNNASYFTTDIMMLLNQNGSPISSEKIRADVIKRYLNNGNFSDEVKAKADKYIKDEAFYYALLDMADRVEARKTATVLNKGNLDMKEGERIDNRNSAMSAVATLIKVPNLVAKSRPLVIYDENGQKFTEGTFMEFAKGKDVNNLAPIDEMRMSGKEGFDKNGDVKKQIADLQVLDYICGNIDRHGGNILYDIDPVTKELKGIVGIDNDSSFGKNPVKVSESDIRLPPLNDMKVISEDMAKTISGLTEGELKSTLHGYGLNEKAIDAAWKRTQRLQEAINNGKMFNKKEGLPNVDPESEKPYLTIMRDEDWETVSLNYCGSGTNNYFSTVNAIGSQAAGEAYIDPFLRRRAMVKSAALLASIDKSQTKDYFDKSKAASPRFFASTRYKNFMAKLKEFHECDIEDESDPFDDENDKKYMKLNQLQQAVDVYKQEKIRDGFIDENWNIKKKVEGKDLDRILLVKDVEKYVKSVQKEKEEAYNVYAAAIKDKKNVDAANRFLASTRTQQQKLVKEKLKKEGIDVEKLEKEQKENVISAKQVVKLQPVVKKPDEENHFVVEVDKSELDESSYLEDSSEELDESSEDLNSNQQSGEEDAKELE